MITPFITKHLDRAKLYDLDHCNAVVERVMSECTSEDEFVLFGKVLFGKHGWGVAAKHYLQIEQLQDRLKGANDVIASELLELAYTGKMEEAKRKYALYAESKTTLSRVREIKRRLNEI
jgi:hypothetical protein